MVRRHTVIARVVLVVAGMAAYANSLHGPFVLDDPSSIVTNPTIRHLWPPWAPFFTPLANVTAQSRPILNVSLALNYAIGGNAVEGYHLLNLAIHLLAGLALFGIVRRTLLLRPDVIGVARERAQAAASAVGFSVALLWIVHPLQTESVTYVIQRAESLMGLFYLLAFYSFVRVCEGDLGRSPGRPRGRWTASCIACTLLCMGTKEVSATLPLLLLLYDRAFIGGSLREALRARGRLYASLAATWLLLLYLVLRSGGNRGGSIGFGVDVSILTYGLTQFEAVGRYLVLAAWPHPLVFEYGAFTVTRLAQWAPWALCVVPLALLGFWALVSNRPSGFLAGWFFVILAPTSVVPGTSQMIVEHRMYLPLAALITLGLGGLARWFSLSRRGAEAALISGAVALAVLFGALTVRRNRVYASALALWQDTLAKRPANPLAHYMLAEELLAAGRLEEARLHYEAALRLNTGFYVADERLGELWVRLGRPDEAASLFEAALSLKPDFADAHNNLGSLLARRRSWTLAAEHLHRAIALDPTSAQAWYNLGAVEAALGHGGQAEHGFREALRLQPVYPEAEFNLANTLVDEARPAEAITHYLEAVRQRPDYPSAEYNLANTLAALRRPQEAIAHYEAALRLNPAYADAELNLGSAYFDAGQLDRAETHYLAALRLDASLSDARANLERVRALKARSGER